MVEARTNPNFMYTQEAAGRAIGRIGRDAYTVLRTKAFQGLAAQRAAIDTILAPLEAALRAQDPAAPKDTPEANQAVLEIELIGLETHWNAIHRVGQAVESLCAIVDAFECYRGGGTTDDVSRRLIRHDLDLQRLMDAKKVRKLNYWEQLSGRPTAEALSLAGLSAAEAKELLAANRTWAGKMLRRFQTISHFYSSPFHQVYAKYRHGYTLASPRFSPLFVMLDGKSATDVEAAIAGGMVVMHEAYDGRRVIHVVRTGVEEIRICLDTARFILDVTRSVAFAWLIEIEHPDHRTIAFDTFRPELIAKWLGTGLDDVYDLTANLGGNFDEPLGS